MAAQIGSIFVSLSLNTQAFAQGFNRAQATTTAGVSKIRRDAGIAEKSVQSFWNTSSGKGLNGVETTE